MSVVSRFDARRILVAQTSVCVHFRSGNDQNHTAEACATHARSILALAAHFGIGSWQLRTLLDVGGDTCRSA